MKGPAAGNVVPICREKALHWAARTGRKKLVRDLIKAGANVNDAILETAALPKKRCPQIAELAERSF